MNHKMIMILVVISALLQGCMTTTGKPYEIPPAPGKDKALVYLMRSNVHSGNLYQTNFFINDVKIVSLYDEGYTWVHLEPGVYEFAVGDDPSNKYLKFLMPVIGGHFYYVEYTQEGANILRNLPESDAIRRIVHYAYVAAPSNLSIVNTNTDVPKSLNTISDLVEYIGALSISRVCSDKDFLSDASMPKNNCFRHLKKYVRSCDKDTFAELNKLLRNEQEFSAFLKKTGIDFLVRNHKECLVKYYRSRSLESDTLKTPLNCLIAGGC